MRLWLVALIGCAHAAPGPKGMGLSKQRAVEVCLPPGEKAYTATLRCLSGDKPQIKRIGSVGTRNQPVDPNDPRILFQMDPERLLQHGEPDLHIVDHIDARYAGGNYTLLSDADD